MLVSYLLWFFLESRTWERSNLCSCPCLRLEGNIQRTQFTQIFITNQPWTWRMPFFPCKISSAQAKWESAEARYCSWWRVCGSLVACFKLASSAATAYSNRRRWPPRPPWQQRSAPTRRHRRESPFIAHRPGEYCPPQRPLCAAAAAAGGRSAPAASQAAGGRQQSAPGAGMQRPLQLRRMSIAWATSTTGLATAHTVNVTGCCR